MSPLRWGRKIGRAREKQGNNGAIVDEVQSVEAAADKAWEQARAVGDTDAENFYDGVRVALAEFRTNPEIPESVEGPTLFARGRKQAWAVLGLRLVAASVGMKPPPVFLPELSEQDRQVSQAAKAHPELIQAQGWIYKPSASGIAGSELDESAFGNLFINDEGIGIGAHKPEKCILSWSEVASFECESNPQLESAPEAILTCHDGRTVTYRIQDVSAETVRSLIHTAWPEG